MTGRDSLWLLVLWATLQCGVTGQQGHTEPPSAAGQPAVDWGESGACLSSTLDLLWSVVGRICRSAVEPPLAALAGRLSGVETQLDRVHTQLDRVHTRLGSVQSQTDARLQSAQTRLQSQLEGVQSRLESRLEGIRSHLESRLEGVQSRLESRLDDERCQQKAVRDCSDLPPGTAGGVHLVRPGLGRLVPAFCDLETDGGGWTVIQRRADIQPRQSFFADWQAYKWGLGELDAEFWWGNEHLWLTTSLLDRRYQLRIDLEDFEGEKRYALYQGFKVSSEADGYRLSVSNYSGNAGDSFSGHSGLKFSTKDQDQDSFAKGSCAINHKAGWWYGYCHSSNLNGLYLSGNHSSFADGVNWYHWKGHHYSLKTVEIKFRPSKKL